MSDAPITTETEALEAEATDTETAEQTEGLPDWARAKLTKANKEAAGYRTKLRDAESANELQLERWRVALRAGVQPEHVEEFAKILQGNSPEELAAHAESIKTTVSQAFNTKPRATDPSQGSNGVKSTSDPKDVLTSLFKR